MNVHTTVRRLILYYFNKYVLKMSVTLTNDGNNLGTRNSGKIHGANF